MFMAGCSKTDNNVLEENNSIYNEIQVVDGHLHFGTSESFEKYLSFISDNPNVATTKSLHFPSDITGFTSLASMKTVYETKAYDELENMTDTEFAVHKAEELLIDPILTHVLDTSLTIGVEDKIYKITPKGTFSISSERSINELYKTIERFDTICIQGLENGEYVSLEDEITFINTFGDNSISNEYFDIQINDTLDPNYSELTKLPIIDDGKFHNNYHNGYNTTQYEWKNNSLWQRMWDALRGKTVAREVEFDENHRVQVTVFDVNYAFYASSGITVKMQQRKKFLGIKYWTSAKAGRIAVGFNYVSGVYNLKSPQSFSCIAPSRFSGFGKFVSTIDGQVYKFLYANYSQLPYIKDWVKKIALFIPEVDFAGNRITNKDIVNKLYETPAKYTFDFLKSQSKKIYDPVSKVSGQMKPKDPRLAYLVFGKSDVQYSKEKPYIMGVCEYENVSSKTVRFDVSFGFAYNSGSGLGPMLISTFHIENIDAFGAIYYNGKWKGVRFTN